MANYSFNDGSKTHIHCCSSLPDRKCGSERSVTSHNLTFTTYGGPDAHALAHHGSNAKAAFTARKGSSVTYMGQKCGLCLIFLASTSVWISSSKSCQSCRQAGCVGWKGKKKITLNAVYILSVKKNIWRVLWSQLPYSAMRTQWSDTGGEEEKKPLTW